MPLFKETKMAFSENAPPLPPNSVFLKYNMYGAA